MSHSVSFPALARGLNPTTVTIIDYTLGGETFNTADFTTGSGQLVSAYLFASTNNSTGKLLIPVRSGATVKLFQWTATGFAEIATTVGLNAIFDILISLS